MYLTVYIHFLGKSRWSNSWSKDAASVILRTLSYLFCILSYFLYLEQWWQSFIFPYSIYLILSIKLHKDDDIGEGGREHCGQRVQLYGEEAKASHGTPLLQLLSHLLVPGTYDGIRQGPEPGIGTGGYELGTDGISTDLSNKYQ